MARVIESQKLPRDNRESIFAATHQDVSQGPQPSPFAGTLPTFSKDSPQTFEKIPGIPVKVNKTLTSRIHGDEDVFNVPREASKGTATKGTPENTPHFYRFFTGLVEIPRKYPANTLQNTPEIPLKKNEHKMSVKNLGIFWQALCDQALCKLPSSRVIQCLIHHHHHHHHHHQNHANRGASVCPSSKGNMKSRNQTRVGLPRMRFVKVRCCTPVSCPVSPHPLNLGGDNFTP